MGRDERGGMTRFRLLGVFFLLLAASTIIRSLSENQPREKGGVITIAESEVVEGVSEGRIFKAGYTFHQEAGENAPVLLLLHDSTKGPKVWDEVVEGLRDSFRILIPDLPGYGETSRDIANVSNRTSARIGLALMEELNLENVHVAGFSSGALVAVDLLEIAPERCRSLMLIGGMGVEELEMLGEYSLNHAVHTVQYAVTWIVQNLTPHFGWFDRTIMNLSFAKSALHRDQRAHRKMLEKVEQPALILHGDSDLVVPIVVAKEHARILPQAELVWFDGGHWIASNHSSEVAEKMDAFIRTAESGAGISRSTAQIERVASSQQPFSFDFYREDLRKWTFVFIILIALSTLVSEDIACVMAGVLAAQGFFSFGTALTGCFLGILVGDAGLYLIGRWFGAPAISKPPLKWLIKPRQVKVSARFFDRYGPLIIIATRWLPGLRVPVYVTAGLLKRGFLWFMGWMVIGAALWTPVLVGLSMLLGEQILVWVRKFENYAVFVLFGVMLAVILTAKIFMAVSTWKGRRLTLGWWRRLTRWEFWPPWFVYPPVVLLALWKGLKHRSLTLFTAVNPAMPAGGVIYESKSQILEGLKDAGDAVARHALVAGDGDLDERCDAVEEFMDRESLDWPIVVKPDQGERGAGVGILSSSEHVRAHLEALGSVDSVVQQYVPGEEFGVFYVRRPGEETGKIISVTEKKLISIFGDGRRTIEELILADDRAVCMAHYFLEKHEEDLDRVLNEGEEFALTDLGTHCRGAMFLDAADLMTPELAAEMNRISKCYDGFYFGRYDLRVPSKEALSRGEGIKVLELNGVTSEATHIYDPKHGLWNAWKVLVAQWATAFEIAAENRDLGVKPVALWPLLRLVFGGGQRSERAGGGGPQPV
ncbi:MAG: alpha/beta fold hydrolase [Verrucomicrobiota bacterium]